MYPTTSQPIYRFLDLIFDEYGRSLPPLQLGAGERRILGGSLFREGPSFMHAVVAALHGRKDLFGDLPVKADPLLRQQERAAGWRVLGEGLRELAECATDNYLYEQSSAILQAKLVLRSAEPPPPAPFAKETPEEEETRFYRRQALQEAIDILEGRRERAERRLRKGRRARGLPNPPNPKNAKKGRMPRAPRPRRHTAEELLLAVLRGIWQRQAPEPSSPHGSGGAETLAEPIGQQEKRR